MKKLFYLFIGLFSIVILPIYSQEVPGSYTTGQISITHSLLNAITANKGYEILDFSALNNYQSNQNNLALYCMGGVATSITSSVIGIEATTTLTSKVKTRESCQSPKDYEGGFLKLALTIGLDKNLSKGFAAGANIEYGLNFGIDLNHFTKQLYQRLSLNSPNYANPKNKQSISVMEKLTYLYIHLSSKKNILKTLSKEDQFSYHFILTLLHPFLHTLSQANQKNPHLSSRWKNHYRQNIFPNAKGFLTVPLQLILNLIKNSQFSLKKHLSLFQNNMLRNGHFPYCKENVFSFQHCTETIADFLIFVDVFKSSLSDCHAITIETNTGLNLSLSFADLMKLKTKLGVNASASLGYNYYHLEKKLSRDTNHKNTSKISKNLTEKYNMKNNNLLSSTYRLFTTSDENHLKKTCHQVTNIAAHSLGQYLSLYKY